MRRSYVAWNNTKEVMPEITGREYLICTPFDDQAFMYIAEFYRAGDTVQLEYKEDVLPEAKSEEEVLLRRLGVGSKKSITIDKDGFYTIEPYCTESQNSDCCESLVYYGGADENVHWAELPMPPITLKHPYDAEDEMKDNLVAYNKEQAAKHKSSVEEFVSKDKYAVAFRNLNKGFNCPKVHKGLILEPDEFAVKETVYLASVIFQTAEWIRDNYSQKEWEASGSDDGIIVKKIEEIAPGSESYLNSTVRILMPLFFLKSEHVKDYRYYYHFTRNGRLYTRRFYNRNESVLSEDALHVVLAETLYKAKTRFERVLRLTSLGALPEVVFNYEFMNIVHSLIPYTCKIKEPLMPEQVKEMYDSNDSPFGGKYDFCSMYGITPDGNECEYDPAINQGLTGEDENGKARIPKYGESEDGERVRYHTARYEWDIDDDVFYERTFEDEDEELGKAYKVVEWYYFPE